MEFNKLVFAGLAVGCLTAAAGGSYLAVRQNQASVSAIGAGSADGAVVPGAALGTSAPSAPNAPVTESEGIISPEPVRPARPEVPPAVSRPATRASAPGRKGCSDRRPARQLEACLPRTPHSITWKKVRYAAGGGPNQVVSVSASPG